MSKPMFLLLLSLSFHRTQYQNDIWHICFSPEQTARTVGPPQLSLASNLQVLCYLWAVVQCSVCHDRREGTFDISVVSQRQEVHSPVRGLQRMKCPVCLWLYSNILFKDPPRSWAKVAWKENMKGRFLKKWYKYFDGLWSCCFSRGATVLVCDL